MVRTNNANLVKYAWGGSENIACKYHSYISSVCLRLGALVYVELKNILNWIRKSKLRGCVIGTPFIT